MAPLVRAAARPSSMAGMAWSKAGFDTKRFQKDMAIWIRFKATQAFVVTLQFSEPSQRRSRTRGAH